MSHNIKKKSQWLGAITWANVVSDLCHHMVSLCHNKLTHWGLNNRGHPYTNAISKFIIFNEINIYHYFQQVSLKFVPSDQVENKSVLHQEMV